MLQRLRLGWYLARLRRRDPFVRADAAMALGRLGDARAVEPLIATLQDIEYTDSRIRLHAVRALERLRDSRAVKPLATMIKDRNKDVREAVAQALGQLGDTHAVEPLIAALKDADQSVRKRVVQALGQLGDPRAAGPLCEMLGDRDQGVIAKAVEALGRLGPRPVEILAAVLDDPRRGDMAAAALTSLGWKPADPLSRVRFSIARRDFSACVQEGAIAVEPLIAALGHSDWSINKGAAEALGRLEDPRAANVLIAATRAEGRIRQVAMAALKSANWTTLDAPTRVRIAIATEDFKACILEGAAAVEPLIAALREADYKVRRMAAEALGQLGDLRAVEPLIEGLRDKDESIRREAAEALGRLGDFRAVEPLIAALMDSSGGVRGKAVQAAAKLRDPRAIGPLVAVLPGPESSTVADALVQFGSQSVEPLVAVLHGPNKGAWDIAARVLQKLGWQPADVQTRVRIALAQGNLDACVREGSVAVEPLIAVFRNADADRNQKHVVSKALVRLGPHSVEPLIALLRDTDDVRRMSAETLGRLGDARAVAPLIAALRDADELVRATAVEALLQLRDVRSVEPLIAALQDEHTFVRAAAVKALGQLGDLRAVEPLIAVLKQSTESLEYEVVEALGQLGDARAAGPLIAVFNNTEDGIAAKADWLAEAAASGGRVSGRSLRAAEAGKALQMAVADALVKLDDGAVEPLIAALEIPRSEVQWLAAKALKALNWESADAVLRALDAIGKHDAARCAQEGAIAVGLLIATLQNADLMQCRTAANALGQMGDLRAVEPLIARLKDDRREISAAVVRALATLGDPRAVDPLLVLLKQEDGRSDTIDHTARALSQLIRGNTSERLSTQQWRSIAGVADVARYVSLRIADQEVSSDGCVSYGTRIESRLDRIDLSDLRQLARQELIRRGEKA